MSPSRLDQRGASRSSRTLRRDAVGVSVLQRGCPTPTNSIDAHGQVAWSWHPDAGVKLALMRNAQRRRRWPKSPEHRGEREAAVPTIARGMPDVSAEPVVPAACIFFAGGPWVRPAPGIPRALCLEEGGPSAKLGHLMPRECETVSSARPRRLDERFLET